MSAISSGAMAVVLLLGTVPCVYTNTGSPGPNTDSPIGSTVLFKEMSDWYGKQTDQLAKPPSITKSPTTEGAGLSMRDAAGKTPTRGSQVSSGCWDLAQLRAGGRVYFFEAWRVHLSFEKMQLAAWVSNSSTPPLLPSCDLKNWDRSDLRVPNKWNVNAQGWERSVLIQTNLSGWKRWSILVWCCREAAGGWGPTPAFSRGST